MKKGFISFLLLFISLFLFVDFCDSETLRPTYCVVGVKNNVNDRKWKDIEIGFGISNLISQLIYDTGEFIPIEEKEEIRGTIKKHRELYWHYTGNFKKDEIQQIGQELQTDFVIIGEVLKCKTSRKKAFVSVFSQYKTTVRIWVRLHMIDQKSGEILSSEGKGYSEKGATSVVFEARDGKIDFNSTMAGIATENAVKDAVENMVKKFKKNKGGS